jgi:hypothetical protein
VEWLKVKALRSSPSTIKKKQINKNKRKSRMENREIYSRKREKIFANSVLDKGLMSRAHKELPQPNNSNN